MYTTGRITIKAAGETHHRLGAEEYTVRREQERVNYGSKRGHNSFLSTIFIPLAQSSLAVDCYDSGEYNNINVITRDNYEFLRDSYFRYSLLLRKEGAHTPGSGIREGIASPYDEVNTLVDDELRVNIEQEAGRLFFRLQKYHKRGSFALYYSPVKSLESFNPVLKRIAITFIHKLMKANGANTFVDYEESGFLFEMLSRGDGSDPEEWKGRMKLLNSYQEGRIGRLLKRVESKFYYKNLPKVLDAYEPQNGFEQSLVDAMERGLPFLTPVRGVIQYTYDTYYSEDPDFHLMYLQQQIGAVHDTNDTVSDYLVGYYNFYSRETYDIISVTVPDLPSDTEELSNMDGYPERLFRWADEFISLIS